MKCSLQVYHTVVLVLILGACGSSEPAGREEVGGTIQEIRRTLGDRWSQLSPGVYQHTGADGVISQFASGRKGAEWRMQQLTTKLANASSETAIAIKAEIQSLEAVFPRLSEDEDTFSPSLRIGGTTALASVSGDIPYACSAGTLTVTGKADWGYPYPYPLTGFVTVFGDNRGPASFGGLNGTTGSVSQTGIGVAPCGNGTVTGSGQVTITGCNPNGGDCTFFARSVPSIRCSNPIDCGSGGGEPCQRCTSRGLTCWCGGDVCGGKPAACP